MHTLRHTCRGEQSLSAARSALSPETGKQHEWQMEKTPSQGKDGQPGIGPSVRGMFSDLKRTMERVGEPILPGHHVAPHFCSRAWCGSISFSQLVQCNAKGLHRQLRAGLMLCTCRAGASPLIQGASTLGRRESSSSLREGLEHALAESGADRQLQEQVEHADMHMQRLPESPPAVDATHSMEDKGKSISDSHSRRSSERGDDTPEVLSADEWGDFDFDRA